jgi:hypothetical protein
VEEEEAPVGAEAGGREMGLLGGCSWAQAVAARRRRSNAVGAMDAAEEGGGRSEARFASGWVGSLVEGDGVFYTAARWERRSDDQRRGVYFVLGCLPGNQISVIQVLLQKQNTTECYKDSSHL